MLSYAVDAARRGIMPVMTFVLAASAALPVAGQESLDDIPQIELRVSMPTGPSEQTDSSWVAWTDAVTEATNGKVTFQYFYSGSLLATTEMVEGIPAGIADLGTIGTPYTPERFPIANWYSTLAALPAGGVPYTLMQQIGAQNEFYLENELVRKEFEDQGLKVLGADYFHSFDLLCTKPVTSLADAAGTRVRVPGRLWSLELENLGFTPVSMVPAEIYEAFSRGIIDCAALRPSGYPLLGLTDVAGQKFYTPIELSGWTSNYLVISKDRWESLPEIVRQIMWETLPTYFGGFVESEKDEWRQFFVEADQHDITVNQQDAEFDAAIDAYQQQLIAQMVEAAPPQVPDPQAMIDQYTALTEKWGAIVDELGVQPTPASLEERIEFYGQDTPIAEWQDRLAQELFTYPPQYGAQ